MIVESLSLPSFFDLRHVPLHPHVTNKTIGALQCKGFSPSIRQESCNACVAASMAIVLSIQACLATGKWNTTYSAQRIWDCYDGECSLGIRNPLMDTFFPYFLNGPQAAHILASGPNDIEKITEANYSRCFQSSSNSKLLPPPKSLLGIQTIRSSGNTSIVQQLKSQIYSKRRPVMAIARMTESVFYDFVQPYTPFQIQSQQAFNIQPSITSISAVRRVLHALAVIGWRDTDGAWLVQNSMGPKWQNNGIGWVLGPLEAEWYTFDLDPPTEIAAPIPIIQSHSDQPFSSSFPKITESSFLQTSYYYDSSRQDHQLDLLVFFITSLSIGVLAVLLCFYIR